MTDTGPATFARRFGWPARLGFPLAIGHRGARAYAVENTLKSFAIASDVGAQMWEVDIRPTRDGVCVVSHDDHLFPVFGEQARISELTAVELAHLPGVDVPSLDAVVQLALQRGAGLYVDIKEPGSAVAAWRRVEAAGLRFAAFGCFQPDGVDALRRARCSCPLAILVPPGTEAVEAAERARADIAHLCWEGHGDRPQDLVTAALLDQASRCGRQLVLWHEERSEVIADLLKLPVLGICSDRPDLLRPDLHRA